LSPFRSVTKLNSKQKRFLLDDIDLYWDLYIDICDGSVTPTLHLLKEHVKRLLEMYGTIGLFSEDAMESIHAVVNALARRYAALDTERRVIQSTRSMEGRKRTGIAATKRKINEHKPIIKRRRTQGACKDGGVSTIEIVDGGRKCCFVLGEN
jgi:hypothetical protein